MNLQVETYPGDAGAEMIRRFHLGKRVLEVIENLDQWHGEGYRYFKVKAGDNNLYILRFNEAREEWELIMFKPPGLLSKVFH